MKLYKVHSAALKRYSNGLIVVIAKNKTEAMKKALLLGRIALLCDACHISADTLLSGNWSITQLKDLYIKTLRKNKEYLYFTFFFNNIIQLKKDVLTIEEEPFGLFLFGSE